MKKKTIIMLLMTVVLMTGCGAAGLPGSSEDALEAEVSGASTQSAPIRQLPMQEEEPARDLTADEVLIAYDKAITAYEWFDLHALPCAGPAQEIEGVKYRRVKYDGFDTLEDLKTYLYGLFSEEVVKQLLPENAKAPKYRDIDGVLHVRPFQREADETKGNITATVEQEDAGTYLINVTADLMDDDLTAITGVECHSFPYEKVDDRWVFTHFCLVY